MDMIYRKTHQDTQSNARCGIVSLPHGDVITPTFMPVGTNGTVKALHHDTVAKIGYNLILGNTYHLYLRPGVDVLRSYGGLHNFSNWKHNILTDSGGFQIFSLAQLRKIKEEGVVFQSHIDGSKHHLTPEKVVDIQHTIGSDILMCLDVCTPPEITYKEARDAWEITRSWARRSIQHWQSLEGFEGKLFGIVQGNFYKELRKESALAISEMDFPGIAIGGLSVGETPQQFSEYLGYTTEFIRDDRPRYVMGIGSPDYILDAVENGIDLFDCVLATRAARNGSVFTDDGMIQLKRATHEFDKGPLSEGCTCTACTHYSRGYLRHLFKAKEMLGGMLASEHNLTYLYHLMEKVRTAIQENRFSQFKQTYLARYYGK
jgi:queuine tRNA-ribosyltransferase